MFTNIKLFNIKKTKVYLNTSVIFIFILLINWQFSDYKLLLSDIIYVFSIFLSVFIHEVGHMLSAKKYGVSCENITINAIGGYAKFNEVDSLKTTPLQEIFIFLNGPFFNLYLASIIALISLMTVGYDNTPFIVFRIIIINLLLFSFNLLPISPMDGGGIFKNILLLCNVNEKVSDKITSIISILLSIIFSIISIYFNLYILALMFLIFIIININN